MMPNEPTNAHTNEIRLTGRVSKPPVTRELPSGDSVVNVQLVVSRPKATDAGSSVTFDAIPCSSWDKRLQEVICQWSPGDIVSVSGSLRRRFWRAEGGIARNTFEVEVAQASVVTNVGTAG